MLHAFQFRMKNYIILTELFLYPCKPSSPIYSFYGLYITGFVSFEVKVSEGSMDNCKKLSFEKENVTVSLKKKGHFPGGSIPKRECFSVQCFARVFGSHLKSSADLSYIVDLAVTICVCVVL